MQKIEELKKEIEKWKRQAELDSDTTDRLSKQLEQKEQECEKLKKQYNCYACDTCKGKEDYRNIKIHCENAIKSLHNKQAEYDQLKAENEQLKEELSKVYEDIKLSPLCYKCDEKERLQKEINQFKAENEELEKWKKEHLKDVEFIERNPVIDILNLMADNIILEQRNEKLKQFLAEIKEIVEPYKMTIKKICGNCKKYDDCHACCYKDINCYKYTSPKTNACEEFTYLDELILNILANNILQKINECEVQNDN